MPLRQLAARIWRAGTLTKEGYCAVNRANYTCAALARNLPDLSLLFLTTQGFGIATATTGQQRACINR